MSDIVCAICYEKFVRDVNPPITCVPCGHTMCKPCLNHWFGNPATNTHGSGSHNLVGGNTGHLNQPTGFAAIFGGGRPNGRQSTCPQCRQQCEKTLFNFALMDSLEKSPGYHNMVTPRPNANDANGDPATAPPADSVNTNQAFIVAGSAMPSAPAEGGGATLDMVNPVANPFAGVESGSDPVHRLRNAEILLDKSEVAIYVIDNSGSMQQNDGKIFQMIPDPSYPGKQKCVKQGYGSVTRWKEAGHKTMQIANYNVERKMRGVYYLLNPQRHANWVDNVDYVYIDPSAQDAGTVASKLNALQNNILAERSIRGSTPLDNVTSHVRSVLTSSSPAGGGNRNSWMLNGSNNNSGMSLPGLTDVLTAGGHGSGEGGYNKIPICYNIITDGEPNDKYAFEREIKMLANEKNFSLFLTVNLCTDDDDIVDYYNDLDQKLGNELSGMDVLDDLEAEQGEVFQQNKFFHYCNEIHVARMAGCNSVIADLMDEESMEAFYAVKVVKELLGLAGNEDSKWHSVDTSPQALEASALRKETGQSLPMWSDDEQFEAFIGAVNKMNREVYDFRLRRYEKVVDMYHFRRLVSAFRKRENWVRWFDERRTGPVSNFFCRLGLKTVKVWCV